MASFASTILGTAVRIPCEVLKQRLQAGLYDNVGEAIIGTWGKDGLRGFFRGTGATLCREVPFYVAGMCLYAEAKKVTSFMLLVYQVIYIYMCVCVCVCVTAQ
jgi:Mitochondrial carrier protein